MANERRSLADSVIAAKAYDGLVGSRAYNRLAWSSDPADYAAFAAEAVGSARGSLLEIAAGPTTETLPLYVASGRAVTITDTSPAMLRLSERRGRRSWNDEALAAITWRQADMWQLDDGPRHETVLGLGMLHMIDDIPALVDRLRSQCAPGGSVWLSGLVSVTRRAEAYLRLLHRSGEVVAPRSLQQLRALLPDDAAVRSKGAMAYARIQA